MTPAELSRTVRRAVRRAVEDGALRVVVPDRMSVERPRPGGAGDWTSNAALVLAGPAGRPPREVAEILRGRVETTGGIERIEITGPGFLNFTLSRGSRTDVLRAVRAAGARYGHGNALAGTTTRFAPAAELRGSVWTDTVVGLLGSQGAEAAVLPGAGETLRVVPAVPDLFRRLGPDAARWALLRPAAHDRPDAGDALLVQRESNPLFLVRYAHARSRAVVRNAAHLGLVPVYDRTHDHWYHDESYDDGVSALLTALADHPGVLEAAARLRAPDRVARQLETMADAFLRFLGSGRPLPVGDEKPSAAHSSRIALAEAAGTVLAGGLSLLGIDAPEHL